MNEKNSNAIWLDEGGDPNSNKIRKLIVDFDPKIKWNEQTKDSKDRHEN